MKCLGWGEFESKMSDLEPGMSWVVVRPTMHFVPEDLVALGDCTFMAANRTTVSIFVCPEELDPAEFLRALLLQPWDIREGWMLDRFECPKPGHHRSISLALEEGQHLNQGDKMVVRNEGPGALRRVVIKYQMPIYGPQTVRFNVTKYIRPIPRLPSPVVMEGLTKRIETQTIRTKRLSTSISGSAISVPDGKKPEAKVGDE